jgi:putative addiction module component (TIGR02574 family)
MGEQLALVVALWNSLDEESRSEALPVDTVHRQELDRRWAAHLQNPEEAAGPPSAGSTGRATPGGAANPLCGLLPGGGR